MLGLVLQPMLDELDPETHGGVKWVGVGAEEWRAAVRSLTSLVT
jgi:hypothetical protein